MTSNSAYSSLNTEEKEIRVLYIDTFIPGSSYGHEEQCITGRLTHISLAGEHIPYYALSYVWGDATPVSAVVLDTGACIPIAKNLLVALEHVRKYLFLPVS
jgi:hypothetical protein